MLDYELDIYKAGFKYIAGTDEAGRGPLCGPVVCAACILPPDYRNELINDSKKLKEKDREALFDEIVNNALAYKITVISPQEIDEINIYEASRKGMVESIKGLSITPDYILTDAMPLLDFFGTPIEALIKGDAKAQCIAAASILAKVSRDRLCYVYDKEYPEYGFGKHKGYGTKAHMDALRQYGPCPIHRPSFLKFLNKENEE